MEGKTTLDPGIITVKYKGKEYNIDLSRELSIEQSIINSQLKDQPSNYAFLCLVRDEYINKRNQLERDKDLAYSEAWVYYKESNDRYNNDMVSNKAIANKKYQSLLDKYIKMSYKADQLISICKAYETRERIIQTISANLRKQSL